MYKLSRLKFIGTLKFFLNKIIIYLRLLLLPLDHLRSRIIVFDFNDQVCCFTQNTQHPSPIAALNIFLIKMTYGSDRFLLVSTGASSRHCLMLMSRLPETRL